VFFDGVAELNPVILSIAKGSFLADGENEQCGVIIPVAAAEFGRRG
jgi:hypothetical protein